MFILGLLTSASVCFAANPLEPNPVSLLAKQGHMLCAIFGEDVISLDTKTRRIHRQSLDSPVDYIFSLSDHGWGVIAGSKLYRWDGTGNAPELILAGDESLVAGFEREGTVYLSNGQKIDLASGSNEFEVSRFSAAGLASNFGLWGDKLVVFGGGVRSVDTAGETATYRKIVQNYFAPAGLSINENEFIVGGGGWPALILSDPQNPVGTMLIYKNRSTYDHIRAFDWEGGQYWMASSISVEGATWRGQSIIRSYPQQRGIVLPNVLWADFKSIDDTLYFATRHGVLEVLADGQTGLYTTLVPSGETIATLKDDLTVRHTITARRRHNGFEWLAGFQEVRSTGRGSSFLLRRAARGIWSAFTIPIEAVRDLTIVDTTAVLAGHGTHTYEGGDWTHVGGVGLFDIVSNSFRLLTNTPATITAIVDQSTLVAVGYTAKDDAGACYEVTTITHALGSGVEADSSSETVCDEERLEGSSEFEYVHDPDRHAAAAAYFEKEELEGIDVAVPDGDIQRVALNIRATFFTTEIKVYEDVSLEDPRSVVTPGGR